MNTNSTPSKKKRVAIGCGLVVLTAVVWEGCSSILGLDEPGSNTAAKATTSSTPTEQASDPASPSPTIRQAEGTLGAPDSVPAGVQQVTIEEVLDGDSVRLAADAPGDVLSDTAAVAIDLLGTKAPGSGDFGEPQGCFGKQATRAIDDLLPTGSTAWVARGEQRTDDSGRSLLYVWNDDGTFVNLTLVSGGYAKVARQPDGHYRSRFADAGHTAKAASLGLWKECAPAEKPANKPEPEPEPEPEPAPEPEPEPEDNYLFPPPPPDLDCSEISATNFQVRPGDPHRFDADGDGIGCES